MPKPRKKVEQLYLEDLKRAFMAHMATHLIPKEQQTREWSKFLYRLKSFCSIVEVEGRWPLGPRGDEDVENPKPRKEG